MKYSKEFYMLIAHFNPAIYDVIFPMGPLQALSSSPANRINHHIRDYQTAGSIFGTDLSGELKLWAKLTWKMSNLIEDLRAITINAKMPAQQKGEAVSSRSFVSELVDDFCGTVPVKFRFPPKPHGFVEKVSIEEKLAAASLFAHASFAVEGTEIAAMLGDGADKILESAMAEFADAGRTTKLSFENALNHS